MEVASYTGTVKYIRNGKNGEDAVSYEIVPSTNALSVDANGNWASGTVLWNQDKSYAVVKCYVYKVVGSKRELCKGTVLYYTAEGSRVSRSIFNNGVFYVYIGKSANVIDVCVYAFNMASGKPVGDPLAMTSITINHDGANGKDGASVTCEYSRDKVSWEKDFSDGCIYMRVKTGSGAWNVMRIVGEKGADGINGSYTKYDFAISARETTTDVNTQPSDIKSTDWQDAPLKTNAAKPFLWYRVTHYDSKGKPGIPSYVRMNGKDGANGTSINIKGSLENSDRLPTSGATLGDCYLIAGELWVYVNEQEGGNTDNMKYGFVNCGSIKGEPGENATQYYYHIAWAENITKDASGKITATGFSTTDPAGIGYPYMGVCYTTSAKDPSTPDSYKWVKVEGKPTVSYEIRLDTNSVTADGKTGKFLSKNLGRFHFIKHTGDKSEELGKVFETDNYIIIYVGHDGKTAEYSLGDGSDNIYDCLMMNTEEETISLMKFFWYDAPVYVSNGNDKDYDYVEELKATQGIPTEHMNLNILSSAVFTVIRQPTDGERGSAGATWRNHKDFVDSSETEPYEYMSGGNDEKFIDAVRVGKIWYRCILKYESTGRTDTRNVPGSSEFGKYWSAADMSMDFIATDFLLAENAKINLFGSNEINLYSSNEDGKIFGSFRVPNGNGDGSVYALWLGAETGSEAPFSVTSKGRLVATDVNVSGTVYAMDGKIAGLKIDGAGLTNEGFDNDAHITLRNDANNTYARIGGNVLPGTSSGMTAVAMFTNGKKAESIADVNCALVCGASGAATNVAIDMTNGGYVMGLRVKTARLSSGGSSQKYPVSIPKGVNSVLLGGGGYYQLPEMSKEDDGYVIMVKNDNSGNVHLMTNTSTTYKGEVKKSFILYNRGDNTEDLTIDSRGDAMIFVYHRDVSLSGNSTKSGCWVQYKCPRDW